MRPVPGIAYVVVSGKQPRQRRYTWVFSIGLQDIAKIYRGSISFIERRCTHPSTWPQTRAAHLPIMTTTHSKKLC